MNVWNAQENEGKYDDKTCLGSLQIPKNEVLKR